MVRTVSDTIAFTSARIMFFYNFTTYTMNKKVKSAKPFILRNSKASPPLRTAAAKLLRRHFYAMIIAVGGDSSDKEVQNERDDDE